MYRVDYKLYELHDTNYTVDWFSDEELNCNNLFISNTISVYEFSI
jgi:hypothetical protein